MYQRACASGPVRRDTDESRPSLAIETLSIRLEAVAR